MPLKVNRLLACKHRRVLLTNRMNYYSPSSHNASVAHTKYPFLGHSNGQDTLNSPPLYSVLKDCPYDVHPV